MKTILDLLDEKHIVLERGLAVVVCGGRYYIDEDRINHELRLLHKRYRINHLIHGGQKTYTKSALTGERRMAGADALAEQWAFGAEPAVMVTKFPADWDMYGKGAGPIRNASMVARLLQYRKVQTLVVAFPGHNGTADMVRKAAAARVNYVEIS